MSEHKRLTQNILGDDIIRLDMEFDYNPCENCGEYFDKCAEIKCEFALCIDRLARHEKIGSAEEFAELKKAKAEGRILPFTVGVRVWILFENPQLEVQELEIESITIADEYANMSFTNGSCFTVSENNWDLWNKSVFLTKAEAEAAMEQIGEQE